MLLASGSFAGDIEHRTSLQKKPIGEVKHGVFRAQLFGDSDDPTHLQTIVFGPGEKIVSKWECGKMSFRNTTSGDTWTEYVDDVVVFWPNGAKRFDFRMWNRDSYPEEGMGFRWELWDPNGNLELQYTNRNLENLSGQIMDGVDGSAPLLGAGAVTHRFENTADMNFDAFVVEPSSALDLINNQLKGLAAAKNASQVAFQKVVEGKIVAYGIEGHLKTLFSIGRVALEITEEFKSGTREGDLSIQLYPFNPSTISFVKGRATGAVLEAPMFLRPNTMVLGSGKLSNGLQEGVWEEVHSGKYKSGCWATYSDKGAYVLGKKHGKWISRTVDFDCNDPGDQLEETVWDHGVWVSRRMKRPDGLPSPK
jgi:hypothetical protein